MKVGNNSGTQWVCDNQNIYINHLTISGGPGNYTIDYKPSLICKLKAVLGIGPNKETIINYVKTEMLGEPKEIK